MQDMEAVWKASVHLHQHLYKQLFKPECRAKCASLFSPCAPDTGSLNLTCWVPDPPHPDGSQLFPPHGTWRVLLVTKPHFFPVNFISEVVLVHYFYFCFSFPNQSFFPTDLLLFDSLKRINKPILFSCFLLQMFLCFAYYLLKGCMKPNILH